MKNRIFFKSFYIKNNLPKFIIIKFISNNLDIVKKDLNNFIKESKNFFLFNPILLDISYLSEKKLYIDLKSIVKILKKKEIFPIAIKNSNSNDNKFLIKIKNSKKNCYKKTLYINKNIRSGQQIYAKNSDLIIKGSVSNGAEILSDGNIHIYGKFRGRILAGINGDKTSKIFILNSYPEIVSISGIYILKENPLIRINKGKFVQIKLKKNNICIKCLY